MRFALLVPFTVACHIQSPVQSSRALLGPERSEIVVNEEIQPAALDVVAQFAQRGFHLAQVVRDERGMMLRLKGDRRTVAEPLHPVADAISDFADALNGDTGDHYHPEIDVTYGSAFYVRLESRGPATTWIAVIGRPIREGAELCTADPEIAGPCIQNDRLLSELAGVAEADVVVSVFTELRLRGVVISPDPTPTIVARQELVRCQTRRQEQMALASRITNSKARANVVAALPKCDELVAAPQPAMADDRRDGKAAGVANAGARPAAPRVEGNAAAGGQAAVQPAP